MIAVLLLLLALIGAIVFGEFAPDNTFVRISLGNTIIESNLWVMLGICLFVLALVVLVVLALLKLLSTNRRFRNWRMGLGENRARSKTIRGLTAWIEGDWSDAQYLLSRYADRSDMPLVNYLTAAQAAGLMNDSDEAQSLLQKARENCPEAHKTIGMTQAKIQFDQSQYEACLATLIRLKAQSSDQPALVRMLAEVYEALGDWKKLSELLPKLKQTRAYKPDQLEAIATRTWTQLIHQTATEIQTQNLQDTDRLLTIWHSLPNTQRHQEVVLEAYATELSQIGESKQAEILVRKKLRKQWSDRLIRLYGNIQDIDASEQLINAGQFLKDQPNNPSLLLTLGKLALRNQLWGKAKEYLEASHALHASQETRYLLSSLALKLSLEDGEKDALFDGFMAQLESPKHELSKGS